MNPSRLVLAMMVCFCAPFVVRGAPAPAKESPKIILKEGKVEVALPENLKKFIASDRPGFRVPTSADMIGEWAKYADKKNPLPYICWGDFNGDKRIDVAIFLLGSTKDRPWKFVVFNQVADGKYLSDEPGSFPGSDEDFYKNNTPTYFHLFTLPAGKDLFASPKKEHVHKWDTIAMFEIDEKNVGTLYDWVPSPGYDKLNGFYGAASYGSNE